MVRDLTEPITISIGNKSASKNAFIPYKENSKFVLGKGDVITFDCFDSNAAAYYVKQNDSIIDANAVKLAPNASVVTGKYVSSTNTFTPGTASNIVLTDVTVQPGLQSGTLTDCYYDVIGELIHEEADETLGLQAGYRFIFKIKNPSISAKSDLPSGDDICRVKVNGEIQNTYSKAAFENDGSLIGVINTGIGSDIEIRVTWVDTPGTFSYYHFDLSNVSLVAESDIISETISIDLPGTITITNNASEARQFIPFKQNFAEKINASDSVVLTPEDAEEVMYYLNQKSKDLVVAFEHVSE